MSTGPGVVPGLSPADVLPQIPGWANADFQAMDGGLTNQAFLLEHNQRRAVLKIDAAVRNPPFNSRSQEAAIQYGAFAEGLAATVLFADEHCYVTDYIDGQVWAPADLCNVLNLRALALVLRRLHALPLCGRRFEALAAARGYVDRFTHTHSGANVLAESQAEFATVALHLRTIEAVQRPEKLCLCHNDLVAGNIISVPEVPSGIHFLDWEYACDNDPLFDLATVVAHHGLSNDEANVLLDAYFDGDGAAWRTQLQRQIALYNALNWLWQHARASPLN